MNDKQRMSKAVSHLGEQLRGIRAGGVDVGFVQTIHVSLAEGGRPLGRLAVISRQGDQLVIRPFDPTHSPAIVKALNEARLSAYCSDPTTVRAGVPALSMEQRKEMARHVKKLGEEAKIAVRLIRQESRKQIEATGRGSFRYAQEATDNAIQEIESLVARKIKEIES